MPTPARKDAMSQMGVTRKPVFELFGMSEDVARNPMFGQQMRQDAWEDRGIQAAQQQADTQLRGMEAAEGFFQQEPSTRQKFLEDNPQIAASPQFGAIARYQAMMPSAADKTLMPQLALKLPPSARGHFAEAVNSGMGVLNAYTSAQDLVEQQGLRERVYGTGATDEDIQRAFPDGRFTPHDAARFEAQRKLLTSKDPELNALQNYASQLARQKKLMWDTNGTTDPELETEWQSVTGILNDKLKSKAFPPASQEKVTDKVTVVDPATGDKVVDKTTVVEDAPVVTGQQPKVNYMDLIKPQKKQEASSETQEISEQWTEQKKGIESKLADLVPDKVVPGTEVNQREAFARAVLDGEQVYDEGAVAVGETGEPPKRRVSDIVLEQMGVDPMGTAFEEKGNQRWGPQGVTNHVLLRAWAEDFLGQRGKLKPVKESPTGGKIDMEKEKAAMQKLNKLINGEG